MSHQDEFALSLEELIASLRSGSGEAAATAADLLELNSFPVFSSIDELYYERLLPPSLLERELREHEERRVVDELHRLILRSPSNREHDQSAKSGLIYALGRSSPWVAIQKILDILVNHRARLTIGDLHQCLHALQGCLDLPEDHSRYSEVVLALTQMDPTPVLEAMATTPFELNHETECLPRDVEFVLSQVREVRLQSDGDE